MKDDFGCAWSVWGDCCCAVYQQLIPDSVETFFERRKLGSVCHQWLRLPVVAMRDIPY